MQNTAHSVAMTLGLLGLTVLASTAAVPAVAHAQGAYHAARPLRNAIRPTCPCAADAFFGSFLDGERQLIACTDDTPYDNFVRLVAENIDLVVLYEFPGQLFCGWQPAGDYTASLPITAAEFDVCRRLMVRAAAAQRLSCPPES